MNSKTTLKRTTSRSIPFIAAGALLLAAAPLRAQQLRITSPLPGAADVSLPPLQADSTVSVPIDWITLRRGLEKAELELRAGAAGLPVRAIVVRIDPRHFRFALVAEPPGTRSRLWSVDDAPEEAALAVNAGQFRESGPWGWVVRDGREVRPPEQAPLAVGIAFDTTGGLRWIVPGGESAARSSRGELSAAFQSFPYLLLDDRTPALVRTGSRDFDIEHRDARVILGQSHDGSILIVLTRFDGLGAAAGRVPIGLTVPESASLAKALGMRNAVMLDGGISGQLLLRDGVGRTTAWRGLRRVPLGLIAVPKQLR